MKNTPGEWFQGTDPRQIESSKDGTIVCHVSGSLSNEATLADAALISASIELYEACARLIGSLGVMITDPDNDPDIQFARAAIAKAEGNGSA